MFILGLNFSTIGTVPMTISGTLPGGTAGESYSHTLMLGGTYTGTITFDASAGSIPSWMTISLSGGVITCSGTLPGSAETDAFTLRANDSGTGTTATSAQSIAVVASGFSDDFTNPTTSAANWATTYQGYSGGSQSYVSNTSLLTTVPSQVNSVSQKHSGSFTDLQVTVAITNTVTVNYFALSIGTGGITPSGGGTSNWWYTVLKSGYCLQLNQGTLYVYRVSSTGATTQLGSYSLGGYIASGASHTYELSIASGVITAKFDGATVITASDSTYTGGGDILIAQGRYSNNQGGNATISLVNAT